MDAASLSVVAEDGSTAEGPRSRMTRGVLCMAEFLPRVANQECQIKGS